MNPPTTQPSNDPKRLAWASLLLGNWLLGIVAIVYANKAEALHLSGQIDTGLVAARRSRGWAYAAFALLWIPFAIIVVAGVYLHYTGAL